MTATSTPDKDNGDVLFAPNLFKHAGTNQENGSVSSGTAETNIGEIILTPDQVSAGVLVIASGNFEATGSQTNRSTIVKLYSGSNVSFGSNTLRKSIGRNVTHTTGTDAPAMIVDWTITKFIKEETWSGTVYVQITGKNSAAEGGTQTVCESIEIIGV